MIARGNKCQSKDSKVKFSLECFTCVGRFWWEPESSEDEGDAGKQESADCQHSGSAKTLTSIFSSSFASHGSKFCFYSMIQQNNFSLKFLPRLPNMPSLLAAGLCLLSLAIYLLFEPFSSIKLRRRARWQEPMSLSNGNAFSCGNVWWTMAEALSLYFAHTFTFYPIHLFPLSLSLNWFLFWKAFCQLGLPLTSACLQRLSTSTDKQMMKHGNSVIMKFGLNTWHLFWWRNQIMVANFKRSYNMYIQLAPLKELWNNRDMLMLAALVGHWHCWQPRSCLQ